MDENYLSEELSHENFKEKNANKCVYKPIRL